MLNRRTGEVPSTGIIFSADIAGDSKSKGSLKNVAKRGRTAHLVEQVEDSEKWKNDMIKAFHRKVRLGDGRNPALTLPGYPYDDAVVVKVVFYFPKPVNSPLDYPSTRTYYDLDKLQRNLGDALEQGHVIRDDARIVEWQSQKRFAYPEGFVGVIVQVIDARMIDA